MPLATLLNSNDPLYDWEHANAHREYLAVMSPLNRFSGIPYFVEPLPSPPPSPADMWNLQHQHAHNDFSLSLPPDWQATHVGFGIPGNQNLLETDWNRPESRTWTTFVNHQEHYVASEAVFPLPNYPGIPGWWLQIGPAIYPFW